MKATTGKSGKMKKPNTFIKAFVERFGIDALNYEVPRHANTLPFTLGGITAASLVITLISGVLLTMWYVPTPEEANASIRNIMETVYLGYVIRGIHSWAASLTLFAVSLHALRVFLYGSYKKPREGNWIVGVILFGLLIGLYFTGTAIKWDQEGYEALEHAQAIAGTFGLGAFFSTEVIPVIMRLFSLHVSILPMLLIVFLFIHMLLVKRHKISPLPWQKNKAGAGDVYSEVAAAAPVGAKVVSAKGNILDQADKKHTFFHHIYTLFGYGYMVLGVVMILAILAPPVVGPDPVLGIEVTKPLWPFLWIYSVEEWFGINGALIASAILFAGLLAVPFFDRRTTQSFSKRKWIISIGIAVVIALIVLTVYAILSNPVVHLDM